MPLAIQVRPATPADLAFVCQDGYISAAIVQRKIAEGEVFVAVCEGQSVGYARLEHLWSVVPYLALIHVSPAYRRQGVGRALLDFIGSDPTAARPRAAVQLLPGRRAGAAGLAPAHGFRGVRADRRHQQRHRRGILSQAPVTLHIAIYRQGMLESTVSQELRGLRGLS